MYALLSPHYAVAIIRLIVKGCREEEAIKP